MISFENAIFKLHPIKLESGEKTIASFMVEGESVIAAFATVRDKVIFTTHRVIAVDIQGVGKKVGYCNLPYARIATFCIETSDLLDLDCKLEITSVTGSKSNFEITGGFDIRKLCHAISCRIL